MAWRGGCWRCEGGWFSSRQGQLVAAPAPASHPSRALSPAHLSLSLSPSPPPVTHTHTRQRPLLPLVLQASFPYIGIADLRAVPLAVLDRLQPVPATFLKQLAGDKDLFWELPVGVQRQVSALVLGGWVCPMDG